MGDSPSERLSQFFDFVWGSVEGFVYLPTKDRTGDEFRKAFYKWPLHRKSIITHVLAASASGLDVYFSPAIFNRPKALKENVKGSQLLWCEFDGNAPGKWPEATKDHDGGQHTAVPGPPSLRVQSSSERNQHCYWKLEEFTTDIDFLERVNRAIAYETRADTSGWDANQILRPPGTVNQKRNIETVLLEESDRTYHSKLFVNVRSYKDLVSDNIVTTSLPDVQKVIGKYTWNEDTLELLLKPLQEIPEGKRSSALMRVGYHCAELGMSDQEAYAILDWADKKWGKFAGRSDRKRRLIDIINRARLKHPHPVADIEFQGLMSPDTKTEEAPRYVFGFNDLLTAPDIKIEWAIKGLMPRGGLGMISSAPGVGKTQLMLDMMMKSALSRDYLGFTPQGSQRTLLLELEMSSHRLKHFIANMSGAYTEADLELLQKQVLLSPLNRTIPVEKESSQKFLENIIDQYKPDGIIIDSIGKIYTGKLSDDEGARKTMAYLGKLAAKFGIYVWVVHHNRKPQESNKRPKDLADIFGSQYWTQDLDILISLWKGNEGKIEVNFPKTRLTEDIKSFWVQRIEHLQFYKTDKDNTPEADGLMKDIDKDKPPDGLHPGITPPTGGDQADFSLE